jgi:hypothetical protein
MRVGDKNKHMNERREQSQVEPFEILARAIPRGKARSLASALGVTESLITKWLREPLSDEAPTATGVPNPIERLDFIFDWMLVHSPSTAQLLAHRYAGRFEAFMDRIVSQPLKSGEWQAKLSDCFRTLADLLQDSDPDDLRDRWEDCKLAIEELIRRREAGESARSPR